MVSIPRQNIVQSQPASPVLLYGGQSGAISVGSGTVGTPRLPGPTQVQYIPGPTQQGHTVGQMLGNIADRMNSYAIQAKIEEAKNIAKLKASEDGSAMHNWSIGTIEAPGPLMLENAEFLKAYPELIQSTKDFVNARAQDLEGLERSFYLAEMQPTIATMQKQFDTKYLAEHTKVKTLANQRQLEVGIHNIVASSDSVDKATAAFDIAVMQYMQSHGLTEDLRGVAYDTVALETVNALTNQPNGRQQLDSLMAQGFLSALSAPAYAEFRKAQGASLALEADSLANMRKIEEESTKLFWKDKSQEIVSAYQGTLQAGDELELAKTHQALMLQSQIEDPSGWMGSRLDELYKVLTTDTVPMTGHDKTVFMQAQTIGVHPALLPQYMQEHGANVSKGALTDYIKDFGTKGSAVLEKYREHYKTQALEFIRHQQGNNADFEYFMLTPDGKSFIDSRLMDMAPTIKELYASGGEPAVSAYIKEQLQLLRDPEFISPAIRVHNRQSLLRLVPKYNPYFLFDSGDMVVNGPAISAITPQMVTEAAKTLKLPQGLEAAREEIRNSNPDYAAVEPYKLDFIVIMDYYYAQVQQASPETRPFIQEEFIKTRNYLSRILQ